MRRLALFIEESIYRGTKWVVFEPNDAALWKKICLQIDSFMLSIYRQGAIVGTTPQEAYFVRCGLGTTMTQPDIAQGLVIFEVGFAPVKPAEFLLIRIQQQTGQTVI